MTQYTMISALTPQSESASLLLRVGRVWQVIDTNNNVVLHTNVILIDEKDNHIMAIIRNDQKDIFKPVLKENGVYKISNIKLVTGPKLYRTADRDLAINFFYKTTIQKKPDTGVIPRYKFELQPFDNINTLVGKFRSLIDVLGMVSNYGQLQTRTNGQDKLDVYLTDARNEKIVVTLWDERANQFLAEVAKIQDKTLFVVITGLLAMKFSAVPSLSTTDATKCYININYAPLNALKDALKSQHKHTWWILHPPTAEQYSPSTGDAIQALPISSILKTTFPMDTQVVRCICRAKIVAILNKNGWYYNSCPTCPRELRPLDGKYYCLACEEETESLAKRYRIRLHVEDQSGFTTITLFDKEAEHLVGVPLQEILAEQSEENKLMAIPTEVNNIVGKYCSFQLEITPYNIIQGCKEYTSTRVFEITCFGSHANQFPASTPVTGPIRATTTKRQKLD